jgi:hypothetical protein
MGGKYIFGRIPSLGQHVLQYSFETCTVFAMRKQKKVGVG